MNKRVLLKSMIFGRFKTQRQFAQDCGLTPDRLSKIIMGKKDPSDEEKKTICEKLSLPYFEGLFIKGKSAELPDS